MKKPRWATVIGVFGIVLSCFGIMGAGQEMFMPKMIEMQKEMFVAMRESATEQQESPSETTVPEQGNVQPNFPIEMVVPMQKMLEMPDWFGRFALFSGITKAAISAFYLFASIWLLLFKPSAIRLFYVAAGLSIAHAIIKGIVAVSQHSMMGIMMMFGGAFSVFIHIVLIIVVVLSNKESFQLNTKPAMQPGDNTLTELS